MNFKILVNRIEKKSDDARFDLHFPYAFTIPFEDNRSVKLVIIRSFLTRRIHE